MSRRFLIWSPVVLLATLGAVTAQTDRTCPAVVTLDRCRVAVENVQYMTKIEGGNLTMRENNPDKFRFALVTLRIDKPASQALTLHCADLTLHYRRDGEDYDVAPAEAMSSFSVSKDEDRTLDAHNSSGPGWMKSKTGLSARNATTIYADVVFAKIEEDTSRMWVCVAQPGDQSPYRTEGW